MRLALAGCASLNAMGLGNRDIDQAVPVPTRTGREPNKENHMARPKVYAHGTVSRSLTLAADADAALAKYSKQTQQTRSQAVSTLILAHFGKVPAKA